MTNVEIVEEIIQTRFSYKNFENPLRQFLIYEYYYLSNNDSFNSTKFNNHSKITFSSVENYFSFPMIFSKCLFHALDPISKHFLTLNDYVNGFLQLYNGTFEEKAKFIFRMFNINNDDYVHIDDLKCVLRYTHIFYNKKKLEIIDQTLDDFFGKKKVFTLDDFIKRTIKKNYGLFFLILTILFEYKNFNLEILNFLDDNNEKLFASTSPVLKSNSGSLLKKTQSKFKSNTNCSSNNNFFQVSSTKKESKISLNNNNNLQIFKLPPSEPLEYISINYGIDLTMGITPNITNHPYTNNDDDSFDSNYSNNENNNSLEDEDTLIDFSELKNFEEDFENLKLSLLGQYFFMNEYNIPKGSNEFEMMSNCGSNFSSLLKRTTCSKRSFNFNFLNNSEERGNNTTKSLSPTKSSFIQTKKVHNSTTVLMRIKENMNASKSGLNTTFSDFAQQASMYYCTNDYFEEEISIYKKSKNKTKKYNLVMLKGYIFVLKKKVGEIKVFTSPDISSSGGQFNSIGVKKFIPLRKLYINNADYNYSLNDRHYYHLSLISTLMYKKKRFDFLFENKTSFANLINLIIHQTNFVSITDDYSFVKDIGKGSFSQMKLMRHRKTGFLYAVKKINKNVTNIEEYTTQNWEKDIITFLSNLVNYRAIENICKCYRTIETLDHLYFLTEYVSGGSLWNFIRKNKVCLLSTMVKKIIFQLAKGIKELHHFGIIHRDLKLENVLMDYKDNNNFTAKIIDFGLSQVITPLSKTKETYGSLIFCSPEILLNIPYNLKVDIWSLGVIAYYLEYTYFPFNIKGNERDQETSNKIIMNELKFPRKVDSNNDKNEIQASIAMLSVIKQCLTKDINQRPSIDQIEYFLSK